MLEVRADAARDASAVARRLVEELAAMNRGSASEGERVAAEHVAATLRKLGWDAVVEAETVRGRGFWWPVGILSAAAAAAGVAIERGQRRAGGVVGVLSAAAMVDELHGRARVFRTLAMPRRATHNVVARRGDRGAGTAPTLLVLAHHDAPHTGFIFSQSLQRWIWEQVPDLIDRFEQSVPLWWPVAGGPLAVAAGALTRSRRLTRAGIALSAGTALTMADVARSPVVPAANDNASGVGGLAALAMRLADVPPSDLRVLLVSCGSEESLQSGIERFMARHAHELDPASTTVVNLETIGSPTLVQLEGEGILRMVDYDAALKDRLDRLATGLGFSLPRGLRARLSTDSLTTHRAGLATATLTSLTPWKALANYHWPTDVAANVTWSTIDRAVALVEALARELETGTGSAPS